MIPTIEDIITGLASGQYTAEQARRWIARHIQMAEERGCTHGVQGRKWHCGRGCEHPDVCMVIKAAAGGACEGSHGVMATPKVEAHGTLFRIEGDTLRFADGSCREATGPEKAMWKKLMEQPADGVAVDAQPVGYVPRCHADGPDCIVGEIRWDEVSEKSFEVAHPENWHCLALYATPGAAMPAEPQWGPILDALDSWPNDCRDDDFKHLERLIRAEHARTLDRLDAARNAGVAGTLNDQGEKA